MAVSAFFPVRLIRPLFAKAEHNQLALSQGFSLKIAMLAELIGGQNKPVAFLTERLNPGHICGLWWKFLAQGDDLFQIGELAGGKYAQRLSQCGRQVVINQALQAANRCRLSCSS